MKEKMKLTLEGKRKLEEELDTLIHVTREEVKKQIAEAKAQGDLSENADYAAARERQSKVEGRIKDLKVILDNAEVIENKASKNTAKVGIGHKVTITFLTDNRVETYKLVGTVESNPFNKYISTESPLGAALLGKSRGDVVEVKGGRGLTHSVRIEDIAAE